MDGQGGEGKRPAAPINFQSLVQWAGMILTLVGFFVYAERRITTIELNAKFEGDAVREMREDLKRSLRNQERILAGLAEAEEGNKRRAGDERR